MKIDTMMSDESDSSDEEIDFVVFTASEMLKEGLVFAGISRKKFRKWKKKSRVEKFVSRYGSKPEVLCEILEDLQTTPDDENRIPPEKIKLKYFFTAMYFLKRYPEEHELSTNTGLHRDTCRPWKWYFIERIRALRPYKIVWPENNNDHWVMTVDGQHCWIHEPSHPEFSQDDEFFSHKYNKAGVSYEIGISIKESQVIWLRGGFKAGKTDLKIFKEDGLREKLEETQQKAIADGGYHSEELFHVLSLPNTLDDKVVKKFKSRALKRHEKFNGMMKAFDCLSERFRHSCPRFVDCFESICVICQYQMEHGSPLFNVLVHGM